MREKKEMRESREIEETRRREEEEKRRQQEQLQLEEAMATMRTIRLLVRLGLNWMVEFGGVFRVAIFSGRQPRFHHPESWEWSHLYMCT